MTTKKHLRNEAPTDSTEHPRKKSKKSKGNGDHPAALVVGVETEVTNKSKDKNKKEKKEKRKKTRKEKKIDRDVGVEEITRTLAAAQDDSPFQANEEAPGPFTERDVVALDQSERMRKSNDKKGKKSKKPNLPDTVSLIGNSTSLETLSNSYYTETASLSAVPETEISDFFNAHSIAITNPSGCPTYRPITSFSYLPSSILISKSPFAAFKAPTPIQAASWPYGLAARDIVGIAETGSGKTLAFALPCVESVLTSCANLGKSKMNKTTCAVIVSPTRELAMQTHEQMTKLCSLVGLNCVCLYGGSPKPEQRALLRKGAAIVVATPGRLKDFLSDGDVSLADASFAVLDEADRMLDKGFEEDIKTILGACPPREMRQTLMFTATWPQSVQALASTLMTEPVKITIGRGATANSADESGEGGGGAGEVKLQANARIKQEVFVVDQRSKEQRALQIIKQTHSAGNHKDRILVFCLYKKEATRVETFLSQRGIKVCAIHGDLKQEQRTRSLDAFKAGKTPVLVATDVAARGLDIPEVKLVLNVTFPLTIEDYVHRIGRTGRAGNKGHAITMFTEHDKAHSGALINVLKAANQPVPKELLKFGTTVKKKGHDSYGAFFKEVDMTKKATKITFD